MKIGAKVVSHGRYVTFQLAEVAVPRELFRTIASLIDDLRPRSAAAHGGQIDGQVKTTGGARLDDGKYGQWPSKRGPISKFRPSDGCKGDAVPQAVGMWYDVHEFGCHLGNVD